MFEEEVFIETNYKAILAEIAKVALEKADILLNTKVIGVKATERESPDSKVHLTTESGDVFIFDEVIMTTPLGWLKRNNGLFNPPLPPRMLEGIDAISVGHLEKVTLPSPFRYHPLTSIGLHHLPRSLLDLPTTQHRSKSLTQRTSGCRGRHLRWLH